MEEYLGLGDSASSFIGGVRYANHPLREYHKNNFRDDTTEFVWTGLRKTVGVSFDEFRKRFGLEFWMVFEDCREELQEFFDSGRLIEENGRLRLSEEGMSASPLKLQRIPNTINHRNYIIFFEKTVDIKTAK